MLQGRIGPYDVQYAREKALNVAAIEYRIYVKEMRIREALRSGESQSMASAYQPGSEVMVYRKGSKKWMDPFQVVQHVDKVVTVQLADPGGTPRIQRFNVAVVKPYFRESEKHADAAPPLPDQVLLTEILAPNGPRQYSDQFLKANRSELQGLCENGTWDEVWTHEVPSSANKMRGRFVLTIQDKNSANEILNSRFLAQGFKDQDMSTLVHSAVLARKSCTRTTVSLAAAHGWNIQSHDVTKAYV
jgi:hypothetical protein